jgi:hypothetical protein
MFLGVVAGACLALLVITTFTHYEVLRLLAVALPGLRIRARLKLILVIVGAFCAHAIEIFMFGLAYYLLAPIAGPGSLGAGLPTFRRCLFFSAETYTSLGYGDIVPHGDLRLLAGMEAVNGLLLIGWTTSYTYIAMARYWDIEGK